MVALLDRLRARAAAVLIGVGGLACLLGCLATTSQPDLAPPTSTAIATPAQTSTGTRTPTSTPIPTVTREPLPTPGPLTETEALALIEEEVTARGVASDTLRIALTGEPRVASIRYASAYSLDSRVFQAQTALITLALARAVARIEPPVGGGLRLAVMPAGDSEVGLRVTVIEYSSLEAWRDGFISDEEFVGQWSIAAVTKE
jgi:hypothetical protein